MPWYKQTAVWGLVLSCIALSLSQAPPIATWKARNEINVELGKRIGLPNTLGLSGYQLFVELRNDGNRSADISRLRLSLIYPNGERKTLPAQSYQKIIPGQMAPLEFPVTTIELSPGGMWVESVGFYPEFSPEDDEYISIARQKIVSSISMQRQQLAMSGGSPQILVEADPLVVNDIIEFFDQKFDLEKGEYNAEIIADVNGMQKMLSRFSFTLYAYHKNTILSQKNDFKYGWGVAPMAPVSPEKQVWAQISGVER